jgi:hypothetical protein
MRPSPEARHIAQAGNKSLKKKMCFGLGRDMTRLYHIPNWVTQAPRWSRRVRPFQASKGNVAQAVEPNRAESDPDQIGGT